MPKEGRRQRSPLSETGLKTVELKFVCTPVFVKSLDEVAARYKITRSMVLRESTLLGLPVFVEKINDLEKQGMF